MLALYKKELQFYLNNPIGYIVIVLFGVFANFLFVKDIFIYGSASLRPFFDILPWLMMVFIPAVAMRSLSEEKRNNTIEVLLSLPISETQIVLAKFFALLTLVAIGLMLTVSLPVSLYFLVTGTGARIYIPELIIGYLGQIFMAAAVFFFSDKKSNHCFSCLDNHSIFFDNFFYRFCGLVFTVYSTNRIDLFKPGFSS